MAKSFTVPCPSCEADVIIREAKMIGKKTDCPKCKYRFKVPDPNAEAESETAEVTAAPSSKKGGSKGLVAAGAGLAAVAILGVAGYFLFLSDSGKPAVAKNNPAPVAPQPQPTNPMGDNPMDPMTPKPEGDGQKPEGDGAKPDAPKTDGKKPEGEPPPVAPAPPAPAPIPGGRANAPEAPKNDALVAVPASQMKDPSNLLPNKTQAVLRLNMPKLQPTPLYQAMLDRQTLDFFKQSMLFDATDISQLYLALVGPDRDPFAVIRTKVPVPSLNAMSQAMELQNGARSPTRGRQYAILKKNPFVTAISRALSTEAIFGQAGIPITEEDKKRWLEKPLAICVYDSQTVLIGELNWMEGYLDDIQNNGYPPFLSELTPPPAPPPAAPKEGAEGGMPPMGGKTGPGSEGPMPGKSPEAGAANWGKSFNLGVQRAQQRPQPPDGPGGRTPPGGSPMGPMGPLGPMGPMGPMGMGPMGAGGEAAPAAKPKKLFTSIPTYRTIKPELKRVLNHLEEDEQNPPAIVYADLLDKRLFARDFQSFTAQAGLLISGLVEHAQIFGMSITNLQKDKFTAEMVFDFVSGEDAKTTANEKLSGLLRLIASLLREPLKTNIQVQNRTGGNEPGGGIGGPGGGEGGLAGEGAVGLGAPGGRGPGAPGGGRSAPGGSPGGEGVGPGGPGFPGGPGEGGFGGLAPDAKISKFELALSDTLVTVDAEVFWQQEAFTKIVQPGITGLTNQLKGRMAVLSGAASQYDLARPLVRLREEKGMIPPTTHQRDANIERYGIPFVPEQRVSFMADLLPYLGRGGLRQSIQEKKFSWYAKEHEAAASTWVSEFLVPYYPQSSWRATHPLGEGRTFGGTNYVAVSGVGLDSARFDPTKPEYAKKVGMTGYDWGSKPAEVTDGLSNTIYMIQVPPSHPRPWIAGGGGTVQGIDDSDRPMDDFIHTAPGGKRGTHVLMGDGSVRFVPEGVKPEVFKAMATRAGGENIADLDRDAPLLPAPKTSGGELRGGGGGPAAMLPKKDEKKSEVSADLQPLQGKWKVKKIVMQGLPPLPPQALDAMTIHIDGNKQTLKLQGIVELSDAEMVIDASKSPKTMLATLVKFGDLPGIPAETKAQLPKPGTKSYSIYEINGDKLIIRSSGPGSTEFPKELKEPEAGSKDGYLELERVK